MTGVESGISSTSVRNRDRLAYSSSRKRSYCQLPSIIRLTFEKTLSLIPSAVCIPVISTVVNDSLSVVTCTLILELCTDPDLALEPPISILP